MATTKHSAEDMNDRKCIVSGQSGDADMLMRFVVGPDEQIVPDLKRNLPGRGCWVTAKRSMVEQAIKKNAFSRSLKQKVELEKDLPDLIDQLLLRSAMGSLGMARKAGAAIVGSAQVDKAVRSGKALAVLHSSAGAPDGVRKITQARRATVHLGGPNIDAFHLFGQDEMNMAFGGDNVIHAALLNAGLGEVALRKLKALKTYRELADDTLVIDTSIDWDEQETDEEE
ncbi:MAG: RNA-binding protein [Ahrensia sp.]|nr:RNA-binding protein [Ahrensia sp.]